MIEDTAEHIAVVIDLGLNGLGIVRSLGMQGIPVIGLDSNSRQIGLFSKYCRKMICPNIEESEEKFIDFLLDLGEQMNTKGILFPSSDVSVLAISRHRSKLEQHYEFPMSELEVIEKLVNKKKFYKILSGTKIPHPKTYFPDDYSDVESISEEVMYPCFVKPVYSLSFKGFIANSKKELINGFKNAAFGTHDVILQEVIPGDVTRLYGFCGYFNNKSEPLAIFTYRRIREWPKGIGTCCLAESFWEPEIVEIGIQFLQSINYHGIMEAEFKKDSRDNKFKFIEVNARSWWQNRLAARCGVDLPYIAYMDTFGRSVEKVSSQKEGIKWLYMQNDLRSAFKNMSIGELSFCEWIKSLKGEKEYAIFAWNDPKPFFAASLNISLAILRRLLEIITFK